jgi:hypothetical protein
MSAVSLALRLSLIVLELVEKMFDPTPKKLSYAPTFYTHRAE